MGRRVLLDRRDPVLPLVLRRERDLEFLLPEWPTRGRQDLISVSSKAGIKSAQDAGYTYARHQGYVIR